MTEFYAQSYSLDHTGFYFSSIESFEGKRSGTIDNLVKEFSKWVEENRNNTGSKPIDPDFYLRQTGLAMRFRLDSNTGENFRIQFRAASENCASRGW